jgi:ferredoxin
LLGGGKRVIAPLKEDGLVLFRQASSVADISLTDYSNSQWSPKEFLLPRTETLFSYSFLGEDVTIEDRPPQEQEQVLFGVRPCDAAGLTRLDDIFLGQGEDPFYARRRAMTTVVSLACDKAQAECFCTAVGGSPAGTEGSDLQMISISDAWLLQALTQKGEEQIAALSGSWTPASEADWAEADEQRRSVEESIERSPLSVEWAETLEKSFDHPIWQAIGERCLGCGICAYVCPSCSCYDINDEGNTFCGTRCRSWDTCTLAAFTRHASGHNPRTTQPSRYRQRVLHKFAYFPLEYGDRLMCVGCGRCVKLCPVGIDIHQSVERAVSAEVTEERQP